MSSAKFTLMGFYSWDNTLFDLMELPEGMEKGLLIDSILMRGGDYEVVYPNPDLLKELIGSWSRQWSVVFSQWLRATEDIKDIQPLENYDRIEEWSDSMSTSEHASTSATTSGSDSSQASESMSNTGTVSAYDSSTLVNNNGEHKTASTSTNGTTRSDNNTTMSSNKGELSHHTGHIHGNIGVTTAGTMYKEFYQVMAKYGNIYDSVTTIFLQAFVIPLL